MDNIQNVGKWYTFQEYYNEEGIQISQKDAKKNYIIKNKKVIIKVNGNTGTKTFWYECEKNKQLRLL